MPKAPNKKTFAKMFDNLQEVIDIDDSRGRSVPINMNFIESNYLTKDTGSSVFGGTTITLSHSDFNYKKKNGTEYRIRASGTYLQKYNTTTGVWANLESGTVTMTIATPAVVTLTNHGLKAGSKISFSTTGALPTGVVAGTTYYVIATDLTANTFKFSETAGGAAVNTSGTQSGVHSIFRRYTTDAEFGWYVYDDVLYGCNAYENYFSWAGTVFTEYDGAPKGNVLEVFEDRMFVAGVREEPLTLYYSNLGSGTAFTGIDIIQPLGTDTIQTIKNYYGVLMVFKRDSIWKVTFVFDDLVSLFVPKTEAQSGNYGSASRKSVSWVENDLWFYTGTEVRAIGFIDQQTGQFGINRSVISEPIKETLALIAESSKDKVATFYHNRRFYLAVPLEQTYNDTTFVCHLLYKNSWTKYTDRLKATAFDFIEVDDVVYSSMSAENYGTIKWDETLTADAGTAITSEVFFKKVENEEFNTFNTYRYIDLLFKDLDGTVTVYARQDANDNRTVQTKAFYVGSVEEGEENTLGEILIGQNLVGDAFGEEVSSTPFLRRKISFLSKSQSITIGLYNSSANDQFTIAAYGLSGFMEVTRLFDKSKITSM